MSSIEERERDILRSLTEKIRSILYEPFRMDANYQLPNRLPPRGPYLLSPGELGGDDVSLDDTYEDSSPMDVDLEHQQAEIDGKSVPVLHFVGTKWENECIAPLNIIPQAATPSEFAIQPHAWQLKGAAQLHYLCRSRFRGGICGDIMGLGKTLLAILALHMAIEEPGCFSLVVCPASCKLQWAMEISEAYREGYEPRVLVLEDARTPPTALVDKWDIVIVSYNFVSGQYRAIEQYKSDFSRFREGGGPAPARPEAALLSGFWEIIDRPIKRVVLDECHTFKKTDGVLYSAVKALNRRATIMLSGTVLSNRWTDIGNPVTMLRGHPFTTKERFTRGFSFSPGKNRSSGSAEPDIIALQRFLLAIVVARPSSCLELPGIQLKDAVFELDDTEKNFVLEYTTKFEKIRNAIQNRTKGNTGHVDIGEALGFAVKAQLYAAHKMLCEQSTLSDEAMPAVEIEDDPEDIAVHLVDMLNSELPKNRKTWLQRLDECNLAQLLESSRMKSLLKVVTYAVRHWPGEKIIIFSTFLKFLDIIARVLKEVLGIDCLRLDGTMDKQTKARAQENFKTEGRILLITSGSGSVGLNLQAGSIVIQCEIWWNENSEKQAYARCYRQGQCKAVKVMRLFATNSAIDASIKLTQQRKVQLNSVIMRPLVRMHDAPLRIPAHARSAHAT